MNENMDCRVMKTCQEVQKLLGEDYEVQIQKTMKNNHCERLGITDFVLAEKEMKKLAAHSIWKSIFREI
mgnify:CR=1 FL=1